MKSLVFLSILIPILCTNFTIDTSTRSFTDPYGRKLLFHGINAVQKMVPFYPEFTYFDPALSLGEQDFQQMKAWGFNFIRLLISWQGSELQPGVYNTTYIETVREIVRMAADYDIAVLLDMHQDLLSMKFCGDGFPMWALNVTNFPAPLDFEVSYDSSDMPAWQDCAKASWFEYYMTENVQSQWRDFYNGSISNLQDYMANFWGVVAQYFVDEPNVIGYEIINEPFSADLYNQPLSIIIPHTDDYKYLEPLYTKVNNAIRQFDNNTIIFFEPIVDDVYVVDLNVGPGGPGYNDKQALSYHVYCWDVNGTGAPTDLAACHTLDSLFFDARVKAATRIGVPGFLTEFGACDNTTASYEELNYVAGLADSYLQSWSYWSYKSFSEYASLEGIYNIDGSIQTLKLAALTRTYMYATCGIASAMSFDPDTANFVFEWEPSNSCGGKNSEFYIAESIHYPNGFSTKFDGCDACSIQALDMPNYYEIILSGSYSDKVTFYVIPN